jgi:hypothetical protein
MLTKRCILLSALFASAVALLPNATVLVWAELDGGPSASAGSTNPYVLSIIDDGDPIPMGWRLISPNAGLGIPLNANGDVNGDGPPAILFNPTNSLVMVAWARNSAAGFDIVLSIFEGGTWSEPQVLAGSPEDELDPSLFLEPDGTVHLVYWVNGTMRRVMHRQAPADLSLWSQPEQVSQAGEQACRGAGVFFNGLLRVAYEVHNFGFGQTPRQIVLAHKEETGFVPDVMAMTNYAGEARPEPHAHAGRLWLDWIDAPGEVAWVSLDAQSHWGPLRYESFNGAIERELLVRRAIRLRVGQ